MSCRWTPMLGGAVAAMLWAIALAATPVVAQKPAVAEDPVADSAADRTAPPAGVRWDEVSIESEFPELAQERLSLPESKAARDAYYRDKFGPVLSRAAQVPAGMLRDAAHKYRRTRTRLSEAAEFRIAEDLREHIELYHFHPIQLYGTLRELEPVTPGDETEPWAYEGTLQVPGPEPLAVRLLVKSVPEELISGAVDNAPVLVTGYLFRLYAEPVYKNEQSDRATPLLVAPRLEWLRAAIDPEVFAGVKDRTDILESERDAYHRALVQARLVAPADQRELAREIWRKMQPAIQADHARTKNPKEWQRSEKPYIDLFKNPELYRGRPVTLEGTLRKLTTFTADEENEYDLTQLYEAWIFPDDSQGNPAVVVFTEKPESLPLGDDVIERVRVTGYFFKMYAYSAQDTTRVAPMILARTVQPVDVGVPAEFPIGWAVGGIAAVVLGVAVLLIYFRAKDKQFQSEWRQKHEGEFPAEIPTPPDQPPSE